MSAATIPFGCPEHPKLVTLYRSVFLRFPVFGNTSLILVSTFLHFCIFAFSFSCYFLYYIQFVENLRQLIRREFRIDELDRLVFKLKECFFPFGKPGFGPPNKYQSLNMHYA